jgi:hypothetical protein
MVRHIFPFITFLMILVLSNAAWLYTRSTRVDRLGSENNNIVSRFELSIPSAA